jgi:hypothetical protein
MESIKAALTESMKVQGSSINQQDIDKEFHKVNIDEEFHRL